MARVDVIVPFYNTPVAFTREALESVRAQTMTDWRVVLVNDGSNEESTRDLEALLRELAETRITYLRKPNGGVAQARNFAIAASHSPLIALLDSDDLFYPHRLALACEKFDADPELAVLHADVENMNSVGEPLPPRAPIPGGVPIEPMAQFNEMLRSNYISLATTTIRRAALEETGAFDPDFDTLEDKELWLRMLMFKKRIGYAASLVSRYRIHGTNTSKNVPKMARGRQRLIDKLELVLKTHPLLSPEDWARRRREMERHKYFEMAQTYLEVNEPWKALHYTMPQYSGVSARVAKAALRALYKGTRGLARGSLLALSTEGKA
jgi:glycosyltransferase involved in cell wall biosynthesis